MRSDQLSKKIHFLLAGALLAFSIIEADARIYLNHFASNSQFLRYASYEQFLKQNKRLMFSPHHYLAYYPSPGYAKGENRHNSLGYRGEEFAVPKPPSVYRIVCLGGSTTYTDRVKITGFLIPPFYRKD